VKLPIVLEGSRRDGYTATCPALPGCVSESDTKEEAIKNIKEAMKLYLRAVTREHIFLKPKTLKSILHAAGLTVHRFNDLLQG
jgi:predicted RNase H-like HicB family nuclease